MKMRVKGVDYNIGEWLYTTKGADLFQFSENGIMSARIEDFELYGGRAYAVERRNGFDKIIELGAITTYRARANAITGLKLKKFSKDFFKKYDNLDDNTRDMYYDKFEDMEKMIHKFDDKKEAVNFNDILIKCDFHEPKTVIKEDDFDLDR